MRYAEVAVNSPAAQRRSFSYSIPPEMDVKLGQAVRVPFGSRVLEGVVIELTDSPAFEQTKSIAGIIDEVPPLPRQYLDLARWISEYYLSPLFDTAKLMLPPGFEQRRISFVSVSDKANDIDLNALSEDQQQVLNIVREHGRIAAKQLERDLGENRTRAAVSQLVRRRLLTTGHELAGTRIRTKKDILLSVSAIAGQPAELARLTGRSKKQAAIIEFLLTHPQPVSWTTLRQAVGCTRAVLDSLVEKRLVSSEEVTIDRDPLSDRKPKLTIPHELTHDQQYALDPIEGSLRDKRSVLANVFLLHGVTGSGKTEVYLQALGEAIKMGKRGIVLVPEISLTPQTVDRFLSRFAGKVAVLHSRLSPGEQLDEWRRIVNGEFQVVVGARSALFVPVPDLSLIVIDEEHEWTYKQQDAMPRYHTRDVAIKLAQLIGATVILGSATPSVESYYMAQRGKYHLLSLPQRVTPVENTPLPAVSIVDMRDELKAGNSDLISNSLSDAVSDAVASHEQVILFLNRRGNSTFVQCRKCGFVLRCRRCDVALTYHSYSDVLVCHLCNYHVRAPVVCPRCKSPRIKFLGAGTQKLEEEVSAAFAGSRVLRWDSDSAKGKNAHEKMMSAFTSHEADILVGTQMITKGLDVPLVTVVGVVNADAGLNLPDFRATERGFQILSQVAGRAGRGERGGKVVFQTYNPEHFAIQAAAKHDYRLFYEREIVYRRQLNYPPFAQLASLIYSNTNQAACRKEAERLKKEMETQSLARGIAGLSLIGPAPAFVQRLRGRYRWQIVLRGTDLSSFLAGISLPKGWTVDIDPVGLV